jgi:hypothetical protein
MSHYTLNYPTLKELEKSLFHLLQVTFGEVMHKILTDLDAAIAEQRDKKRFQMKDKREVQIDTAFGPLLIKRNYYYDRQKGKYLSLLDQYLQYDGSKGFSPFLEEWALEMAAAGPSYRQAVNHMESVLGYRVMSHEALRQHLLQTEIEPTKRVSHSCQVLFVETDGLYTKRQRHKRRGQELKIAAVHEGWEVNGKRVKLKNKRHYIHQGKESFWEGFETFLEENYDYDPLETKLIINGDGASWITASQEYFRGNSLFVLDRYHVARDIRALLKEHARYRHIQIALKNYDADQLLLELHSAIGTLETEEAEGRLEALIQFLEKHKKGLMDYRKWLREQGVDTTGMRPMGSAEATMSVFAKRLKNGRSWSEKGLYAMAHLLVAMKDRLSIKTIWGHWNLEGKEERRETLRSENRLKRYQKVAEETVRSNIPYLQNPSGTPIYKALKALSSF